MCVFWVRYSGCKEPKTLEGACGAGGEGIRRATRKRYSAEEKIPIVLEGLRSYDSIAEMCRREGIAQGIYYKWPKNFMEVGKRRLSGDVGADGEHSRLLYSARQSSMSTPSTRTTSCPGLLQKPCEQC